MKEKMNEKETRLIETLVDAMKKLEGELSGFRGEMKEFKNSIKERVGELEVATRMCQVNPKSCANARRLEEHLRNHGGTYSRVFTALGFVTACTGILISVIALIGKRG